MTKPVVAIAGASGFVGSALIDALTADHPIIALGRSRASDPAELHSTNHVIWRKCDLFSLLEVEKALLGADIAIYLVHSMIPSAKLTQGNFVDMDLILADNFARAAKKAGVRQIIYLTGLIPDENYENLSDHLRSRLEVEQALAGHDVPVTALRAGLVVGPGGSSFDMMYRLVKRLPVMILPRWTKTLTHPIALSDVIDLITYCLDRNETFGKTYDIGGPDVMTYQDMLAQTAEALGLKRTFFRVPFLSPKLSRLWIRLITGVSFSLISPLIESLKHPMVAQNRELQDQLGQNGVSFIDAVRDAIEKEYANPQKQYKKKAPSPEKDVRSVQRLLLPTGKDARWVAKFYAQWLPEFMRPFLHVDVDETGSCSFYLSGIKKPLLILSYSNDRSTRDRTLFYITGGILSQTREGHRGRLEFRNVLNNRYVLVAIHDFSPTLPWYLYNATQAIVHLWVMHQFGKHLTYLDDLVHEK